MIGNQTKGKSFRGLLNYLENKESSCLIGGNMFGRNASELSREFRLSRQLNPEALKVVHHVSLSLSPGEQLDNDTWCSLTEKYMESMGYTANQYAIYRHNDRDHDHIHICASRISLDDGKITRDSWEYVRSEKIIRQLELEYGLQQTLGSKEKLHRAPSIGQQQRVEREQIEYEQGLRETAPQQPIKTQLIELIDRATQEKPTMPQLIERLQMLGVEVRHGVTRNGKSKGISYSWNDQKFSGTSLGPAYTFPGLQKHRGVDYQAERDDARIEHLLKNPVGQGFKSEQTINAIVDYIDSSVVESTLVETLPELTELTEQLLLYQQQLKASRTELEDLTALMAQREQQLISQKAVDAIVNYIDSSAVESTLVETLPELTEQLSLYQQQLKALRTELEDFGAVITQQLQQLSSSSKVDVIAPNKAQTLTPDQPKLTPDLRAELYKYYSADLHSLLVTDRDKEIAFRALLDNQPVQNVEEILLASPARWTNDEAKALVLIANNRLASNKQQEQSKPQWEPPAEDESLRPILQNYLTQKRGLTNYLVEPLQRQGLGYIDQQRKVIFIKRDLNGEKSGALVWDTHRQDNRAFQYPENSDRSLGWFHLKLGGEPDSKIERVFLCDSPIDALSMAEIDRKAHKGLPPVRTMYMALDDPQNLPQEYLKNVNRIGLAFNNDSQGNETAQVVQKMLPQAKRIAPSGLTWNEILIEAKQKEMLEQKQRSRGFSR